MKYLIITLLILTTNKGFSQTNNLDPFVFGPNINAGYGPCVIEKKGKTYCEHVGETFQEYVIADGWFSFSPFGKCIHKLYSPIPFMDISLFGENHFIKYKNGKVVNGKINDVYPNKAYEKIDKYADKYTIKGSVVDGLLNGKISTYLNGNLILTGWAKEGNIHGLWKRYYNNSLLLTCHFNENNRCPANITRYYSGTNVFVYSIDYLNGHPNKEIRCYQSGDTLSILRLIDSTKMIYSYVKFHTNGIIMEKGEKQLENPSRKQWNGASFSYKDVGVWEYFDEKSNLLRKKKRK